MNTLDFGLTSWDTTANWRDRDRRYERAMELSHYQTAAPSEFARADFMFHALWSKVANRVNQFAVAPPDLPVPTPADEPSGFSDDSAATAASCTPVVEILVTGLRTAGAPQHKSSAHLGSGAAAA